MLASPILSELVRTTDSKILMLVVDGLGGATNSLLRRTELEVARVPNLDRLAQDSAGGLSIPVAPGITSGSGPGQLALLGYDPVRCRVGRGALEAVGVGLELASGDVAVRGNLATVGEDGTIIDRRAGRLSTACALPLVRKLDGIQLPGVETTVAHVADYRFVVRFRGSGLSPDVEDTDPQMDGVGIPLPRARSDAAAATATLGASFVEQAARALEGEQANGVLLRGWSGAPELPSMAVAYGLRPAAIAAYPMYRGLAALTGMEVLHGADGTLAGEVRVLKQHLDRYDFFYVHYKAPDLAGEAGDFEAKRRVLEHLDGYVPTLRGLGVDVVIIAGDHATPSSVGGHSWHAVPFLLHSRYTMGEGVDRFTERDLRHGQLGQFEARHAMTLALAHAGKLRRYGA